MYMARKIRISGLFGPSDCMVWQEHSLLRGVSGK